MMVPICWGCVRNGIGSLLSGRTVFMQGIPKLTCTWSRAGPGRFKGYHPVGFEPDPYGPGSKSMYSTAQLWRNPSAVRFHCATLSAIMRVDFIAAWLSWA